MGGRKKTETSNNNNSSVVSKLHNLNIGQEESSSEVQTQQSVNVQEKQSSCNTDELVDQRSQEDDYMQQHTEEDKQDTESESEQSNKYSEKSSQQSSEKGSGVINSQQEDSSASSEEEEVTVQTTRENPRRRTGVQKKKKDRWIKEVQYYQKSTSLLMQKAPFIRLIKEVAEQILEERAEHKREILSMGTIPPELDIQDDKTILFTKNATEALQEAAEDYIVNLFQDANMRCIVKGRDTLQVVDMYDKEQALAKWGPSRESKMIQDL